MSAKKKEEKDEPKELTLEEKFDKLAAKVRGIDTTVKLAISALERVFGIDINRDGKIGIILLALSLTFGWLVPHATAGTNSVIGWKAGKGNAAEMFLWARNGTNTAEKLTWGIDESQNLYFAIGGTRLVVFDSSGNMTVTGTTTSGGDVTVPSDGFLVGSPSSLTIGRDDVITPLSSYVLLTVTNSVGTLPLQTNTLAAPGASYAGKLLTIVGQGPTNTVLQDTATVNLGGDRTIGDGDLLELFGESTTVWVEKSYSDN